MKNNKFHEITNSEIVTLSSLSECVVQCLSTRFMYSNTTLLTVLRESQT